MNNGRRLTREPSLTLAEAQATGAKGAPTNPRCEKHHRMIGYSCHRTHLSTNRLAAANMRPEVQHVACATALPLAVFLGVEQRLTHHLSL